MPVTEAEWLTCTDPQPMLQFLRGKVSDRKLRLFAVACCRRIWHLLTDERSRNAVDVAEGFADGKRSDDEMKRAATESLAVLESTNASAPRAARWTAIYNPASLCGCINTALVRNLRGQILREPAILADPDQTAILRDIFGRQCFRSVHVTAASHSATVKTIAIAIYEDRAFDRLPFLADALEEAGCMDAEILNHCRQPGEHWRGCWVVDLILGKQ
jgi:hypothetical protein